MEAYADGACRGSPEPGGCGAWIIDSSTGEIVASAKRYVGERETNNTAEYHGLLLALELAEDEGIDDLRVYMDSEVVIKQMRDEYRARSARLRGLRNAWKANERGMSVEYVHISRRQNGRADRLANAALDEH